MNKRAVGAHGEELALRHLESKGYALIAKNAYFGHNEIDLIMQDEHMLVFVEVKSRGANAYGLPREAVDKRKQRRMAQAAQAYLVGQSPDACARFDVVEVHLGTGMVTHISNAFSADGLL